MELKYNITGLQHLGIPVLDLEKSIEFYEKLGFDTYMKKELQRVEGLLKVAFLRLNQLVLELYQLDGEEYVEIKYRNHGHIDHIALNVLDIEGTFEKIKKEE